MEVLVAVILVIVLIAVVRSGVRPKTDSQGRVTGVRRVRRERHRSSGLIGRRNPVLPARYCGCGKLRAVCDRDEKDATHATGMVGPRRKR